MAVTYVGSAGYGVATLGTTNLTVPRPAGVQVGDLLIAVMSSDGPTVGAPSGWTQHPNSIGDTSKLWWRIATPDDVSATSYAFTRSNNIGVAVATIVALRGARATSPIEAVAGVVANNTATVSVSSVTATNARYLFTMVANFGSASYTPPASQTEAYDYTTPQNHPVPTAGGYDTSPVTAGATGTRTWTSSAAANHRAYNILVVSAPHAGSGSSSNTTQVTGTGDRASSGAASASATSSLEGAGSSPHGGSGGVSSTPDLSATGVVQPLSTGVVTAATSTAGGGSTARRGSGTVEATAVAGGTGQAPLSPATGTGALALAPASLGSGSRPSLGTGPAAVEFAATGSGSRAPVGTGILAAGTAATAAGARVPVGTGSSTAAATTTGAGTNAEFRDITLTAALAPAAHRAEIATSSHSAAVGPGRHSAALPDGRHTAQLAQPRHSARIEDA